MKKTVKYFGILSLIVLIGAIFDAHAETTIYQKRLSQYEGLQKLSSFYNETNLAGDHSDISYSRGLNEDIDKLIEFLLKNVFPSGTIVEYCGVLITIIGKFLLILGLRTIGHTMLVLGVRMTIIGLEIAAISYILAMVLDILSKIFEKSIKFSPGPSSR